VKIGAKLPGTGHQTILASCAGRSYYDFFQFKSSAELMITNTEPAL
jgi:hypothetical protein